MTEKHSQPVSQTSDHQIQAAFQRLADQCEGVGTPLSRAECILIASVLPTILVKNGWCTDCGGTNEHFDHCLTKTLRLRELHIPPGTCERLPMIEANPSENLNCAADGAPHPSAAHKAGCPVCNPTKTVPELNLAYVARCEGGSGGPCCDPDCEECWPDEPMDDATRYALGAM